MKTILLATLISTAAMAGDATCNYVMQKLAKNNDYTREFYKAGDAFNASVYARLTVASAVRFKIECKNSSLTKKQYKAAIKAGNEAIQVYRDLGLLR